MKFLIIYLFFASAFADLLDLPDSEAWDEFKVFKNKFKFFKNDFLLNYFLAQIWKSLSRLL
jgi:hypothetical protein